MEHIVDISTFVNQFLNENRGGAGIPPYVEENFGKLTDSIKKVKSKLDKYCALGKIRRFTHRNELKAEAADCLITIDKVKRMLTVGHLMIVYPVMLNNASVDEAESPYGTPG
jgi:hypothetical protein